MRSKLVIAALALAFFGVAWSFAPIRLTPLDLGSIALPAASPPAGMSVSTLPTADIESRAGFAVRGGSFSDVRMFSQTALLVRHPRGDLLIDTGLGARAREHFATMPWIMQKLTQLTLHTPAVQQLRAAGYDFAALAGIVPTHVHWDHISGVPDFAAVPVWLNADEQAFAHAGGMPSALFRSFGDVPVRRYELQAQPYFGFARSYDVWGDGSVVLVPAPGHTPGSILAFVALPSGKRYALLGDLVWQSDGVTLPAERPLLARTLVDDDAAAVRVGIAHVAALHARFPELTLLPAHDARAWAGMPVFPQRAE
jgi:N-acyl homoserine lactone hydrolase